MHRGVQVLALLSATWVAGTAAGQDIRTERVAFPPGAAGTVIRGTITGDESVSYLVGAATPYRGQLWQSGEHVIEVINRGSGTAGYSVTFGIE